MTNCFSLKKDLQIVINKCPKLFENSAILENSSCYDNIPPMEMANPLFSVQYKFRHHSLTLTDQIRLELFNFSISATLVEFVLV